MPAPFVFPDRLRPDPWGRVASGGELNVETVLKAYRRGIFPWSGEDPIPWCAPDPRCVLYPDRFIASRSLKKLARAGRYNVRFDRDVGHTIRQCAESPRNEADSTWITPNMVEVYTELARLRICHSVEVYEADELVGGLYGLTLGAAFFGESMFSRQTNASKLALWTLCRRLVDRGFDLIDCQAVTPHLLGLGAVPIALREYLSQLEQALKKPSWHDSWADW